VTSFITTLSDALAESLKRQGLVAEQGFGLVAATSEMIVFENAVPAGLIELMMSATGDRLDRTTSPHEAVPATTSASAARLRTPCMRISFVLMRS
jgi:hypothetical protein